MATIQPVKTQQTAVAQAERQAELQAERQVQRSQAQAREDGARLERSAAQLEGDRRALEAAEERTRVARLQASSPALGGRIDTYA
ncbi:MAG: hypothetical protein V4857_18770 [Pseudomonadota bacterium]